MIYFMKYNFSIKNNIILRFKKAKKPKKAHNFRQFKNPWPFSLLLVIFLSLTTVFGQVANREHYVHQPTFDAAMSNALDGNVMGYQYSFGDENGVAFTTTGGLAKTASDNDGTAALWSDDSQMIIASVSKMICTVAIMDMLEENTVANAPSIDNKLDLLLMDNMPERWVSLIDGNEDQITLRHLLNHHSGLAGSIWPTDPVLALSGMMTVAVPDTFDYENVNMDLAGLMAVYMTNPSMMNFLETTAENFIDETYDAYMIANIRGMYQSYVQQNIFQPAGIVAECAFNVIDTTNLDVLAYNNPSDTNGANNFDQIITCMSNSWIMSTEDLILFAQKWCNPQLPGNILDASTVAMINEYPTNATLTPLGWNRNRDTYGGQIEGYAHDGLWWRIGCSTSSCDVNSSAFMVTQDNAYMAIHVNSISATGGFNSHGPDMISAYDAAVCASDIILFQGNMKKYNSASNSISTINNFPTNINNGETRVFKAGDNVVLHPGFRAEPGSVFRAYIDTCNNLPTEDP